MWKETKRNEKKTHEKIHSIFQFGEHIHMMHRARDNIIIVIIIGIMASSTLWLVVKQNCRRSVLQHNSGDKNAWLVKNYFVNKH